MRRVGIEPTRLAPRELESRSLTARTSSLSLSFWSGEEITCCLQDVGFEPTRFSPLAPQASPLTTWVILLKRFFDNEKSTNSHTETSRCGVKGLTGN